jgi:thiamine pyrophosphate-dependent acetolactate synthase large subunit-like protein
VQEAARMLAQAASPLVFVGRGAAISGCTDELLRLIDLLDAPCFTTPLAKGVICADHPLNVTWGGRYGPIREILQSADAVLVVGSSLDESDAGWYDFAAETLIQIDTCPEVIGRTYPVSVGLVGDAKAVLEQLLAELSNLSPSTPSTPAATRVAEHRRRTMQEARDKPYWPYVDAIQRALPSDAIVFSDGSQANYRGAVPFLQRDVPNTFQVTRMAAALGFALPAAIGAKIACPERAVVAIAGDGGFLFTVFALSTAVQQRLGIVAVVFNNDAYGIIRRLQTERYGREVGAALSNPDFVQLAQAYGARGTRAETPDQLAGIMATALEHSAPTVIEVPVEGI